eukprot:5453235-Pyramimonas_sp.AAC.1
MLRVIHMCVKSICSKGCRDDLSVPRLGHTVVSDSMFVFDPTIAKWTVSKARAHPMKFATQKPTVVRPGNRQNTFLRLGRQLGPVIWDQR